MTPRQRALALIREAHGHFYDMGNERNELIASAHSGRGLVWNATLCHTIAVNYHTDRPAGWRDFLDDLKAGTSACTTVDCETCAEPDDCGDVTCVICCP